MKEKNKRIVRRWMSTVLIIAMLFACVINDISLPYVSWAGEKASASDAIRNSRVTLKNRKAEKDDKVQIFVLSDQQDYQPGDTVCLELYIKNNTDEIISEGLLRYKAKGIEEDSAYFEDLNDLYTKISEAEEKAAKAEAAAKESKEEETESEAQTEESQEQAEESSPVDESDEAEPNSTEETTEAEDESSQDAEEPLQTGEPETTAEEEIKEEAKDASGELSGGDILDNETGDTDENDEEEEEDDPTRLTDIEIEPGKAYYVNFYYTIDPEIEKIKDQNVEFTFSWADDDALIIKRPSVTEKFQYTVDGLNLLPVAVGGEKKWVQIGEEDEMLLEFGLGRIEEILEEAEMEELEKNPDATISSARRSSASNALIGWDAEDDGKLIGKDDPAVVRNLKLDVETFDLKLNDFTVVPVDEKIDNNFGTTVACKFKVSRVNEPGTYYGKVNASYKIKSRTYYTSQAFRVIVKPEEGEMELTGKIGKSEIVMYGDVSAFPKADELSLKISEVTKEQQEKVEEALRKKSEEEGVEIKEYKALDIKLIADGVETEPKGDVKVRFKNVKAEEPEKDEEEAAEEAQPETQSVVKRFFSRMRSAFRADNEAEPMNIAADDEIKADVDKVEANGAEAGTDKADEVKEDEKTEKTVEDEKSEADSSKSIKVLHLDEENVVTEEMTSEVLDNGDIVMDTTHFSIYIVVNVDLPKDVSKVPITVYHRAIIDKWEFEDGKLKESSFKKDGSALDTIEREKNGSVATDYVYTDTVLYPGAKEYDAESGKAIYDTLTGPDTSDDLAHQGIKLYETDELELPNGGGTGAGNDKVDYKIAVNEWSKVSAGGNYKVKKVYVKNRFYENGRMFEEPLSDKPDNKEDLTDSANIIQLAETGNEITIYYEATEGDMFSEVGFHDYNVTIDATDAEASGEPHKPNGDKGVQIRTNKVGMNNLSLGTTDLNDNRIGIGIRRNGDSGILHNYPGRAGTTGGVVTKDIPKPQLNEGEIEFTEIDPGLFTIPEKDAEGNREIIVRENRMGTSVDYIAKHYVDDYQLKFLRTGDRYILTSVLDNNSHPVVSNLEKLQYTTAKYNTGTWVDNEYRKEKPLYTNLFWPMDKLDYGLNKDGSKRGIPGTTMDYEFGGQAVGDHDSYGFPLNDEKKGPHNWFFGMRYDVEFSIGDYTGPMDYYFRGDDDFWLFIDDVFVTDVDLGGIHQAEGAYIDLRTWMQNNLEGDINTGSHTMSVFYMERGGTGSCCYMAFTLPNAISVPTPEAETIERTVKKEWKDGQSNSFRKPITVILYQDEKEFSSVILDDSNNWQHTWENLPKNSKVGEQGEHIYSIKEVNVPNYTSTIVEKNGIFTITNVRETDIPVKKEWIGDEKDKGNCRPEEISVQLYKKSIADSDTSTTVIPGDVSEWGDPVKTQKLSDENDWQYIWKGLPLYEFDEEEKVWKKVLYNVKEVDAEWLKTSSTAEKGWYTVSYDGNMTDGYIIKNTYEKTEHFVTKIWDDKNNTNGLRPETITLQLQINDTGKAEDADADYRNYGERFTLSKADHEDENTIGTDKESWKYIWTDLPKYTIQKNPGGTRTQILNRYRVVEILDYTNHEYYISEYGPKGEDGTVITNKLDIHELPETGGPGTLWYTFGGLVLMAFALMYNILRRRKVLI